MEAVLAHHWPDIHCHDYRHVADRPVHRDYYIKDVYVLRDVIEGILGYFFLIAMTLTSFQFGRRYLKPRQWKYLHKLGIYSLWVYAFSEWLELYLPYWPFEPYIPLFVILLGIVLATKSRALASD